MKALLAATVTVLALTLIPAAQAGGFHLSGYHASRLMNGWAAQSHEPLPPVRVSVEWGDPMSPFGSHTIYLPNCCTQGWTHGAIQGLLFHELGHVYDRTNMTPALRSEFRAMVGVPQGWNWWAPSRTIRYVTSPDYVVKIAPGEMFAEEYAACSLGLTQLGYQEAGYNTYGWVPPAGADAALCTLIRSAA